jgi:multidrug efflux system membrane fusion protein
MKRFLLIAVLILAVVGGLVWWRGSQNAAHEKQVKADKEADAIPVVTVPVAVGDVPVFLDGIGTVQALYTVNIHSMVDGPLVEVKFREGQDVKAGDVLAKVDPRTYQATYDQDVAKKAQDQANLENARRDLTRYDKLAQTHYTTGQQFDTQRATVAQDEAVVRQDQAQIDAAKTNLGYTTIVAPVDGRTGIRQVDAGNLVHSTDTTPITVVTTLHPISVVFTLPQQDLPLVTAAMQSGAPDVVALPQNGDDTQVLDRGKVAVLDNEIDQTTGTIKLKATFPNTKLSLWPGAFVNVRLALNTERGVTTVPTNAVQRGPAGAFVFVVQDGVAHRRSVTIPHQDENVAVVSDGVRPGELVVTDGTSRLTDGAKVKIVAAAPAGNG